MHAESTTRNLMAPLDEANRRWALTERARQRKARLRDTAIKSIAKRLSVAGADIASQRHERAMIRASIYNAVMPALSTLEHRRLVLKRRARIWMAAAAACAGTAAVLAGLLVY